MCMLGCITPIREQHEFAKLYLFSMKSLAISSKRTSRYTLISVAARLAKLKGSDGRCCVPSLESLDETLVYLYKASLWPPKVES